MATPMTTEASASRGRRETVRASSFSSPSRRSAFASRPVLSQAAAAVPHARPTKPMSQNSPPPIATLATAETMA